MLHPVLLELCLQGLIGVRQIKDVGNIRAMVVYVFLHFCDGSGSDSSAFKDGLQDLAGLFSSSQDFGGASHILWRAGSCE